MRKFIIQAALLLLLVSLHRPGVAQPVPEAMKVSREMANLQFVLNDTTHLSFTALLCYEHIDSVTVRDTMQLLYQVSKNKFHIVMSDSVEVVQNDFCHLALYHDREMAIVSRPLELGKYLFNANITDIDFYHTYINKVTVTDTASYRKLSYQFKPGSPYEKYDILYHPGNYRIYKIQYQIRKHPPAVAAPLNNARYCTTIWFSNYQTGAFTDQVFSTDPYFKRKEGKYHLAAPYKRYELINSLNQ